METTQRAEKIPIPKDAVEKINEAALNIVRSRNQSCLTPIHILIAIAGDGESPGGIVLNSLGIGPAKLTDSAILTVWVRPGLNPRLRINEEPRIESSALSVFTFARNVARLLNQELTSLHVLFGLFFVTGGLANTECRQVLERCRIKRENILKIMTKKIGVPDEDLREAIFEARDYCCN